MVSAWRKFKNIFSRPLFTIIFRPEMLKFHPYSILTGDTMVGFVIFYLLIIGLAFVVLKSKRKEGKFDNFQMDPDHVVHAIIRVNENNFSVCGFETFLTGNKSSDKNLMFLVKKKLYVYHQIQQLCTSFETARWVSSNILAKINVKIFCKVVKI